MANQSWSSVRGRRARVTKVTATGKPIANVCATIVTDGFITVGYSPEIEEGEEILVKNAGGKLCITDKGCDTLKRVAVEAEFCGVNPELFNFMTGSPLVLQGADAVGFRLAENVNCDVSFALEVWSDITTASAGGLVQYGYFLTPNIAGGVLSEFTIENDAASFSVASNTRSGEGWGFGPYPVNTGSPALATAFTTGQHMDLHLTTLAPPAVTASCTAVTAAQVTTSETGT